MKCVVSGLESDNFLYMMSRSKIVEHVINGNYLINVKKLVLCLPIKGIETFWYPSDKIILSYKVRLGERNTHYKKKGI